MKEETIKEVLGYFETHDVEALEKSVLSGLNPNTEAYGYSLIQHLISMYTRTPRFKECVAVLADNGLIFADEVLLSVLLDDYESLSYFIDDDPDLINKKFTIKCAYTPLEDASLLHICAEYNHVRSAKVLVNNGADVNCSAGTDRFGFGGQTPIFHTVNQNSDNSAEMLDVLLENNASLELTVQGLIWGKGSEWETLIPSVNPISYAMMGLLPQMHRDEKTIADVIEKLLHARYGVTYQPPNIPCQYLQ